MRVRVLSVVSSNYELDVESLLDVTTTSMPDWFAQWNGKTVPLFAHKLVATAYQSNVAHHDRVVYCGDQRRRWRYPSIIAVAVPLEHFTVADMWDKCSRAYTEKAKELVLTPEGRRELGGGWE